jgi:hypothetical protein
MPELKTVHFWENSIKFSKYNIFQSYNPYLNFQISFGSVRAEIDSICCKKSQIQVKKCHFRVKTVQFQQINYQIQQRHS